MDKIRLKVLIKRAILDGIKYHYEMAEIGRGGNFDQFAEDRIKDFEKACVGEYSDENSGLHKHIVMQQRELLVAFFKFFRDNGEVNIGMSIEQFVDAFLATNSA